MHTRTLAYVHLKGVIKPHRDRYSEAELKVTSLLHLTTLRHLRRLDDYPLSAFPIESKLLTHSLSVPPPASTLTPQIPILPALASTLQHVPHKPYKAKSRVLSVHARIEGPGTRLLGSACAV